MLSLKQIGELVRRTPMDLVGIDLGSSGVKVVRMKKAEGGAVLLGAALLPCPAEGGSSLVLPSKLRSRYASLAVSGPAATLKLLSFPGSFGAEDEEKLVDSLGVDPAQSRIAYRVLAEPHGKGETRVLAVALPEQDAQAALALVPSGLPAPFSLEVSAVAAMTAFVRGAGAAHEESAVGLIDFGAGTTTLSLFNKGVLSLVRRFETGTDPILRKIRETLGVDDETARGIIADGAFDVSQSVSEVMEEIVKQVVISRDFVERRENCSIATVYLCGNPAVLQHSVDDLRVATGAEIKFWNPLEGLATQGEPLAEDVAKQGWRFAAAIGACLATLEAA